MNRHRLRTRAADAEHVQITVQLPVDVFDRVKELATEQERSMSNQITVLLRRAFETPDD